MNRFCTLLFAGAAFSAACHGQSPGTLSVSQNAAGEVVATASAWIPECGVTALGDPPMVHVNGHEIDVLQPLAGVMCASTVPPDAKKFYAASANAGRLANGTYTVNWSFPALSATYTVGNVPAVGAGFTGSWYNPQQSGHGLQVEVLDTAPPQALVTWYVFAPGGGQDWISGTGTIDGNRITVQALRIVGAGALFPPNFDPAHVERQPWGTLTLTFSDCRNGQLAWHSSLPGYGDGVLPITRLSLPAGLTCP